MESQGRTKAGDLPLPLGSPLRVPVFAWRAWAISWRSQAEFLRLVRRSERAYEAEWKGTTRASHVVIAGAARVAGLSDANQCLNSRVGELARTLVSTRPRGPVAVLDVGAGAGATTLAVWGALADEDRSRVQWVLLDPAKTALANAGAALLRAGAARDRFQLVGRKDLDALPGWKGRFDLIVGSAAVHHHAYLLPVFQGLARALKPRGFLILGDWFNGLSLHPGNILALLKQIEWPTKETDLAAFVRKFPASAERRPRASDRRDRAADAQIGRFWLAYVSMKKTAGAGFLLLEGHRRVRHYVAEIRKAGLHVPRRLPGGWDENPCFIRPDSSLLGVLLAIKP